MKHYLPMFILSLFLLTGAVAAHANDPTIPSDTTQSPGSDCICAGSIAAGQDERNVIKQEAEEERKYITSELTKFENWLVGDFFNKYVRVAMQDMASTLTAAGLQQVAIFGTFLDGAQQLENQRTMQSLTADAHANYQTSTEMCAIGTVAIGLGAASRNGEALAIELARRSQARQLGSMDTAATTGPVSDRASRLARFKQRYCNPAANDGGLSAAICPNTPAAGQDRDIDYSATLAAPNDVPDNADVIALDNNLFSSNLFTQQTEALFKNSTVIEPYLDARSVIAKRSVAENSFFALAGMKSAGSDTANNSGAYVQAIFQQLGASADDAKALTGTRPSYYTLLDALTRRLYQSPAFFSNLYDTPANVARKDVAMQALGLMLDRDQYKSELRSEANLAVLLELDLTPAYQSVQRRIHPR